VLLAMPEGITSRAFQKLLKAPVQRFCCFDLGFLLIVVFDGGSLTAVDN